MAEEVDNNQALHAVAQSTNAFSLQLFQVIEFSSDTGHLVSMKHHSLLM